MKTDRNDNRIDTTLGELVATISEVAYEYSHDTKEAYNLARLVLVDILKKASPRSKSVDRHFAGSKHLH
ncbi:MAG: hypothetical protein HYT78_02220 [Deltaproteobacteria bacterium]|nr:hypothetical protein [Deltaproteobacteria bacterium]